jgi:hypothetical protein
MMDKTLVKVRRYKSGYEVRTESYKSDFGAIVLNDGEKSGGA